MKFLSIDALGLNFQKVASDRLTICEPKIVNVATSPTHYRDSKSELNLLLN